ncbi:MAG: 5-deoxy-glucuronate isomerase [Pseudomonadota bacterium]
MHIPPHDNGNAPIIGAAHDLVPLTFFNIVKLSKGETFTSHVAGYETCVVPATGAVSVTVGAFSAEALGGRGVDVWDGEPEGVYVPSGLEANITCMSETAEVFIAGAKYDEVLEPFAVRADEIDLVQYGSDDTKTHRKIKHILGQKQHGRVGRLLVSELYTVGTGGWSGFPAHKHDTDRLPDETRHDEVYNFRFRPGHGSGVQLLQQEGDSVGEAFHIVDGSTFAIRSGYHPCVVMPGYEMYYFTILGGLSQRPLKQFFQPTHADQLHTIPGILDMVAKFA